MQIALKHFTTVSFFLFSLVSGCKASELSSVYRITAGECSLRLNASLRIFSGFTMRGRSGIITSLHAVAGCENIVAENAATGQLVHDLHVSFVDVAHDVAELRAVDFSPTVGFDSVKTVAPHERLRVWGFPLSAYVALDVPLEAFGNPTVTWEMVNGAEGIRSRHSPDTATEMIGVSGFLEPGDSGAPVLDGEQRIVGVADGGIREGSAGIGVIVPIWAVEWKDAALPESASEIRRLADLPLPGLFAVSDDGAKQRALVELVNAGVHASREELIRAARAGDQSEVRQLLAVGIPPDTHLHGSSTALYEAVKGGHVDVVKTLIAAHANRSFELAPGSSIIDAALRISNPQQRNQIFDALLEMNPNPLSSIFQGPFGVEVLQSILQNDEVDILLHLTQIDPPLVSRADANGNTIVHLAAQANAVRILKKFFSLKHGEMKNQKGLSILQSAIDAGAMEAIDFLAKTMPPEHLAGCDALARAISDDNLRGVIALIENIPGETRGCNSDTPLFMILKHNNLRMIYDSLAIYFGYNKEYCKSPEWIPEVDGVDKCDSAQEYKAEVGISFIRNPYTSESALTLPASNDKLSDAHLMFANPNPNGWFFMEAQSSDIVPFWGTVGEFLKIMDEHNLEYAKKFKSIKSKY